MVETPIRISVSELLFNCGLKSRHPHLFDRSIPTWATNSSRPIKGDIPELLERGTVAMYQGRYNQLMNLFVIISYNYETKTILAITPRIRFTREGILQLGQDARSPQMKLFPRELESDSNPSNQDMRRCWEDWHLYSNPAGIALLRYKDTFCAQPDGIGEYSTILLQVADCYDILTANKYHANECDIPWSYDIWAELRWYLLEYCMALHFLPSFVLLQVIDALHEDVRICIPMHTKWRAIVLIKHWNGRHD